MMISLPERRPARLVCQFGLSRAGLYAVADWYLHGTGKNAPPHEQIRAGWLDDIAIPEDDITHRFVTLESLRATVLREGLARAAECGATRWIQLRDPYNWFSSLHEGIRTGSVMWPNPVSLEKWKDYARICRETSDWLNYNRWFSDPDYRRALASAWEFVRFREGEVWPYLPSTMAASSFDGRRFGEQAHQMDVLHRYTRFADEPWWREKFDDETISLAGELFGIEKPW